MLRTLALQGPLDTAHAAEVRPLLHEASVGRAGDLVVDLSGVTRIDGTGLGMLAAARLRVQRRGGRFRVVGARAEVAGCASAARVLPLLSDADVCVTPSRVSFGSRRQFRIGRLPERPWSVAVGSAAWGRSA